MPTNTSAQGGIKSGGPDFVGEGGEMISSVVCVLNVALLQLLRLQCRDMKVPITEHSLYSIQNVIAANMPEVHIIFFLKILYSFRRYHLVSGFCCEIELCPCE